MKHHFTYEGEHKGQPFTCHCTVSEGEYSSVNPEGKLAVSRTCSGDMEMILAAEILRLAQRVRELAHTAKQIAGNVAATLEESFGLTKRVAALEEEVRLLRRERDLLIKTDRVRCDLLHGALVGVVPAAAAAKVSELKKALLALHQEARGGLDVPGECACLLCQPREHSQSLKAADP